MATRPLIGPTQFFGRSDHTTQVQAPSWLVKAGPRANGQATYLDLTNLPTTIRYCLGCRDVREGVPWRVYNACLASMARPEGHFIFVRNAGRL